MTSGPWLAGKKDPPTTASAMVTTATAEPACSSFRVKATARRAMPVAAVAAASISVATAAGSPHRAPRSSEVPRTMTPREASAMTIDTMTLPTTMDHQRSGAASSRARVPARRSACRLMRPNWAEKKTKTMAMAAA